MQVKVDVKCMETSFGGRGLSGFGVMAPFRLPSKQPNFPFGPWSSKNLNDRNQPKKIMQAEVDITCMHTNFGEHGLSTFGDFAPYLLAFKMAKISLQTMDYSPWGSKIRISSKNSCKQRLM